eukprot:71484-Alexandrium_andersonii.AAC.1
MGDVTPGFTGRLFNCLPRSVGFEFADVPNGLGPISKVLAAGRAQTVADDAFDKRSRDQPPDTLDAAGVDL